MNLDQIALQFNPETDYTLAQIKELATEISYSAILSNVKRGKLKARSVFGKYYVKGKDIRDYILLTSRL